MTTGHSSNRVRCSEGWESDGSCWLSVSVKSCVTTSGYQEARCQPHTSCQEIYCLLSARDSSNLLILEQATHSAIPHTAHNKKQGSKFLQFPWMPETMNQEEQSQPCKDIRPSYPDSATQKDRNSQGNRVHEAVHEAVHKAETQKRPHWLPGMYQRQGSPQPKAMWTPWQNDPCKLSSVAVSRTGSIEKSRFSVIRTASSGEQQHHFGLLVLYNAVTCKLF